MLLKASMYLIASVMYFYFNVHQMLPDFHLIEFAFDLHIRQWTRCYASNKTLPHIHHFNRWKTHSGIFAAGP